MSLTYSLNIRHPGFPDREFRGSGCINLLPSFPIDIGCQWNSHPSGTNPVFGMWWVVRYDQLFELDVWFARQYFLNNPIATAGNTQPHRSDFPLFEWTSSFRPSPPATAAGEVFLANVNY